MKPRIKAQRDGRGWRWYVDGMIQFETWAAAMAYALGAKGFPGARAR